MFDSLVGTLVEFEEDYAVVGVAGIRFRVEIPGSTASQFPAAGEQVTVYTHLSFNANDGTFALFGFGTKVERECFFVLNSLSGIGPRKALAILSQIEIGSFARAILEQDVTYVSKIKGVGKKTAERLIVELREKMVPFASARETAASGGPAPVVSGKENVLDAVQALMALGTRQVTAEKAVAAAVESLGEEASTEDLVRQALRHR